ncbi:MAG: DNA-processing protein DprA [Ilumatobacter sp.]|uniref:DNA-processing protein DprA n=1 Tax=Ilumatobacter sp. TaxID=1967498 RepID=UPI00262B275D|nr:DNA-processing protein DprA [Ilumatobacter sp.]MDJ0768590.1 DNA-processing protein DprA [Ilumatobacter sp.]
MSAGSLAILAGLPAIGPKRLRLMLAHHRPDEAVALLRSGRALHPMVRRGVDANLFDRWRVVAGAEHPDAAAARCAALSVNVVAHGDTEYPAVLVNDPEAPAALFVQGSLEALHGRRVGVIGTRNATASGRATASELGEVLAAEGVAVVSGLARGIDGAAHRGVRTSGGPGRPVAVVGNGADRPYPKQHADLWAWVASAGVVISEWPPGVQPDAWRFPLRNRVLAALCEVLVVVESRETGGSLITARAAAERGVEVMAVPGSPRCRSSAGTNQLLVDGVAPVTSALDVLTMLGLDHRRQGSSPFDPRPVPHGVQARVLDWCAREPSTLDMLVAGLDVPVAEAALAVARLEHQGWLLEAGGWFEPAGSRLAPS